MFLNTSAACDERLHDLRLDSHRGPEDAAGGVTRPLSGRIAGAKPLTKESLKFHLRSSPFIHSTREEPAVNSAWT